jgi:hypothetical protein
VRHAPPVQVRSHGVGWRLLQSLLFAWSAAAFVAWAFLHAERSAWPAGAAALVAGLLAWRLLRAAPVDLAWDGTAWLADGVAGRVDLMMDVAGFMLVRWRPAPGGAARWIPLSRRHTGGADHALRVALYARAPVAPDAATELWRNP